jgi:predicted amidophosphoribosyltransferase
MRRILWNREIQKQCTTTHIKRITTPEHGLLQRERKQNLSNAYELSEKYWLR